jgi:hypothetical protein
MNYHYHHPQIICVQTRTTTRLREKMATVKVLTQPNTCNDRYCNEQLHSGLGRLLLFLFLFVFVLQDYL